MDVCFAQLHLQISDNKELVKDHKAEDAHRVTSHETFVDEENFAVVCRRFIHVKRLARLEGVNERVMENSTVETTMLVEHSIDVVNDIGVAGDKLSHPLQ